MAKVPCPVTVLLPSDRTPDDFFRYTFLYCFTTVESPDGLCVASPNNFFRACISVFTFVLEKNAVILYPIQNRA
jgi:hypothetical protein